MKVKKINNKRIRRVLTLLMATVLTLTLLISAGGCSSDSYIESSSNYIRVISEGKKLEMKVSLTETGIENVYLFALEPWQSPSDILGMSPIAECKVKDNVAQIKYDVTDDLTETLTRGYVLGKHENSGYKPVSGVYYVINPRDVHKKDKSEENAPLGNIKGAIGTTSQLMDLGASSTVITADLGKLMAPEGGIGRIAYTWNGYTCYADRDAVEQLDKTIKSYSDAGIYVFLELVQTTPYDKLPDGLKSIAFPGAPSSASGYALNMTGRDGAIKICGIFDFLAGRYASDGSCGRAHAFIIGRNVNNYAKNYAGAESLETTAQNYISAVRAAYNILMSHDRNGRVYVSVDNNWSVSNSNARDFLSTFANMADDGGDFYWQVAIEANASDATLSSIWMDDLTGAQPEFISPANIDLLSSLLSTGQYTCNGMKRNILLNRFAVGGENEDARASSYAYAYYKCLDAGNIDGLIYAKVADSADDPLTNGLLTAEGGGALSQKKLIGEVMSSIDCLDDGRVNTLGSGVGNVWEKLYQDHRDDAKRRDVIYSQNSDTHSGKDVRLHTDFSNGDKFGFTPSASASYTELKYSTQWNRPVLYTKLDPTFASDGAGVLSGKLKLKEIKDAGFLDITALATASGSENVNITIRLSGYTKDGVEKVMVSSGTYASNTWVNIYCDITEYLKNIKSEEITVSVLTTASDSNGRAENLWLSQISTEGPVHSGMPLWLIITLIVVGVLLLLTLFVVWFRKNYTFVRE